MREEKRGVPYVTTKPPKRALPENLITGMKMPLSSTESNELVSGEACAVQPKEAIRESLERTAGDALRERIGRVRTATTAATGRACGARWGSLSAFGHFVGV